MSPDQVEPVHENGDVVATRLAGSVAMPMRISPKRVSPCTDPSVPNVCPPSGATEILTLVVGTQAWNALRITCCHCVVGAILLSVWYRQLGAPLICVPSGAKLSVSSPGSGHGWPSALGVSRS